MANLDQTESNNLLAATSGQAPYNAPVSPIMVALVTTTGSSTTPGAEVVGGSYARQEITFAVPANGAIASNVALAYSGMPACTVTGVDEYDSATPNPVRRWFGPLSTPKTVNAGDTFSIASGSYIKNLS